MQRVLFHKSHDIENKLLIIIHADKMSVQKEIIFSQTKPRAFFLKQNLELFFEPFTLKTHKKGHLITYFHQWQYRHTRASHLFSRKYNQGVARFQKANCFNSHWNNFCFQNTRSRFQDSFKDKYSFTKLKMREMRELFLETIICLSC